MANRWWTCPAVLASRVRVLGSGRSDKNDPNDARSVAIAALRQPSLTRVRREDQAQVLRMLAKRHLELTSLRTQAVCRLHAVLMQLRPGGIPKRLSTNKASRALQGMRTLDPVGEQRRAIARTHLADIRRLDRDIKANKALIRQAVAATGTTVTDVYGVGPIVAAFLIGYTGDPTRFATADHYAAYNGTAPIEVSSGGNTRHRLSLRGNRKLNHAIHMAAVTQIRFNTPGRGLLRPQDRRRQNQKGSPPSLETTHLQRRLPPACHRRATSHQIGPGGHPGTSLSRAWPASHPDHRLFRSATPGHPQIYTPAGTTRPDSTRPKTPT